MNRDRSVDALRAFAIVGVVLGHWLVSAVVSDPYQPTALHLESPLSHAPGLVPVTWVLETLGLFFFAGGFASARSSARRKALPWMLSRLARFAMPVLALGVLWSVALLLLTLIHTPSSTRDLVWALVSQPLWFLAVYLVLTLLTPWLRAIFVRCGLWVVPAAVAVVAVADVFRPLPSWSQLLVVPVGWAVPYLLGIALAEDRLPHRAGVALLVVGVAAGAALVLVAGYPASAVGVPGDRWSNLSPPSLAAVALACAQIGVFLVLRPWLSSGWAPIAVLNRSAMTLYCWHQTALLLVTFGGLLFGHLPGLLDAPVGAWPWHRLVWLPVFAIVLAGLVRVFRRVERQNQGSPVT